jgi:rubrerythrin
MLHELSHNVHGPHDAKFHALWDQLRKEYEALLMKGYTGEGFMSEGHKLGGRRVPKEEARRIARNAAEKRRTLSAGSGQKLGGAPVRAGTDIRQVILNAIERRSTVLKGCGSDNKTEKEIRDLGDQATQNGFRTKAEEDKANDSAIAQALWELVQEDQKKEQGDFYVPPTSANPAGSGGNGAAQPATAPTPFQQRNAPTREPPRNVSRLVTEASAANKKAKTNPAVKKDIKKESATFIPDSRPAVAPTPALTGWTCEVCTLHNRIDHLACDACTVERPESISRKIAEDNRRKAAAQPRQTRTWSCHRCSTLMEDKWWTCQTCGMMKQSS